MSIDNLKNAFILINNHKKESYFTGPKSTELLKKAEKALGVCFPKTYKMFLERYGCGNISSLEINGLINDNFSQPGEINVIWFTLDQRKTGAPHNFIFIASTGYGPQYVLDASQPNKQGEYPVLLWMSGAPTEKVNDDFGEFLLEQVQQALEPDTKKTA